MHLSRFKDSQHPENLRPVLKEPAGKWDPVNDRFKEQTGGIAPGLQEQLDAIGKQVLDLPAEGIKRKTPKKGNADKTTGHAVDLADDIKEQVQAERPRKQQGGSGAVRPVEEPLIEPYDPASGIFHEFH
jgi:hypothetical protein